jgi:hypothetical protein
MKDTEISFAHKRRAHLGWCLSVSGIRDILYVPCPLLEFQDRRCLRISALISNSWQISAEMCWLSLLDVFLLLLHFVGKGNHMGGIEAIIIKLII